MKKLIHHCAVMAATIVSPALCEAQSNVTLSGVVDVTARHASNAASGRANAVGDGAFSASKLNFKGREDLGDGAAAIFSLEMGFDPSSGVFTQGTQAADYGQSAVPTGRAFGREALVGLAFPKYGTLTLGRQNTLAHQLSSRFQTQGNPNMDVLIVFSGHHIARQDNMIKYTNQFGPVGIGASYTASEGNGHSWSASGSYTSGPVDLVAYTARMQNATATETRNIYATGGNYAITSSLKAFLGFMLRSQQASERMNRVWVGGMTYNFSAPWLIAASYTKDSQGEFGTTASGSRSVASITADYLFSKRTDVYLEVDQNNVEGGYALPAFMATKGRQSGAMVGVRHRF